MILSEKPINSTQSVKITEETSKCEDEDYYYNEECDENLDEASVVDYEYDVPNITVVDYDKYIEEENSSKISKLRDLTLEEVGLTEDDLLVVEPKKWNPRDEFINELISQLPSILIGFVLGAAAGFALYLLQQIIVSLCCASKRYISQKTQGANKSFHDKVDSGYVNNERYHVNTDEVKANSDK